MSYPSLAESITGLFYGPSLVPNVTYEDIFDLTLDNSSEYQWIPAIHCTEERCKLNSLKISGEIFANASGEVTAYLVYNEKKYMLLNQSIQLQQETISAAEPNTATVPSPEVENTSRNPDEITEIATTANVSLDNAHDALPDVTDFNVTDVTIDAEMIDTEIVPEVIPFEHSCVDTCNFEILNENFFNESPYLLSFELTPNISLHLKSLRYVWTLQQQENISEDTAIPLEEETVQQQATVGQPVKWVKNIKLPKSASVQQLPIELPKGALGVKVYKITPEGREEITDKVTIKPDENDEKKQNNIITGYAIIQQGGEAGTGAETEGTVQDNDNTTNIIIETPPNEIAEEIEIEYFTEPPQKIEVNVTALRKLITVYSDFHYENITAYTTITEAPQDDIKVYHIVNGERQVVTNVTLRDTNANNLIDTVEWIIPSLSNQTYEIIIEITNAEHLDTRRRFISNIYNEVRMKDGVWSEPIRHNEYVRVTFQQNLTSSNDITIYARNTQGSNTFVEVYTASPYKKITEFPVINAEKYYKVYLTTMQGTHDRFDLRVKNLDSNENAYLEFDYIVDPTAQPNPSSGEFDLWPQACAKAVNAAQANTLASACNGTYPSTCGASGDRLSCNDAVLEDTSFAKNKFGGVRVNTTNSSITNCKTIDNVFLCYEWWAGASATFTNCLIAVDANGGGSYTTVSSVCPGTTANPGMTCSNVTQNETWECGNFFGATGTRALARNELSRSTTGTTQLFTDALFFNVTYTIDVIPTPGTSAKNETTVYQNMSVIFNTTWTDDTALSSYIFGTNQSGTWVNTTATIFTGVSNLSTNTSFITATPPTSVGWIFYANDSLNQWNQTATQSFTVQWRAGSLSVVLDSPTGSNNQPVNTTFSLKANVTCTGQAGSTCGIVNGTARYNVTANPDTNITGSNVFATPFYTIESNPLGCGSLNSSSPLCNLTWTVNATGAVGSSYRVDVNFTSSNTSIASALSAYTNITIISASLSITLSTALANVQFGSGLVPGSTNNNATNNSVGWYNVTCDYQAGNCNISIRGNSNFTSGANIVGLGNVSWNRQNDSAGEINLTSSYAIINETLPNLATQLIYFWLDIPLSQVAGDYVSNFTIQGQTN